MGRFEDYHRSAPRTTRGGIKAQSSRGTFGKSWWARRWISVLESFDIGERLTRGKSYARKGQVLSVDIQEGHVRASVQGSRAKPYDVKISVTQIPLPEWQKLSRTAFTQAIIAAKLLAGEMPEDVETHFTANSISLFPARYDDLETECSCPDFSNPCKHIAAVYYLLGEEFDRDPFLVFRLRGMSKDNLLELIAKATDELEHIDDASLRAASSEALTKTANPSETLAGSISIDAKDYWKVTVPDQLQSSSGKIPTVHASLPKRLGNFPFWRGSENLFEALEEIYRRAADNAQEMLAERDF